MLINYIEFCNNCIKYILLGPSTSKGTRKPGNFVRVRDRFWKNASKYKLDNNNTLENTVPPTPSDTSLNINNIANQSNTMALTSWLADHRSSGPSRGRGRPKGSKNKPKSLGPVLRDYNDDEDSLLVPFPASFSQHPINDFNGFHHALEPHVEILSEPPNPILSISTKPKRGRPRRNTILM